MNFTRCPTAYQLFLSRYLALGAFAIAERSRWREEGCVAWDRGNSGLVLAIGLLGLATSPVAGNALALLLGAPRRGVQLGWLLVWGVVVAISILNYSGLNGIRSTFFARRSRSSLLTSAIAISTAGVPALAAGQGPSAYSAVAAAIAALWLAFFLFVTMSIKVARASPEDVSREPALVAYGILPISLGLAALAYALGPEPGDAIMAFRGSSILAGVSSAVLTALALANLDGRRSIVGLLAALYLNFVAASRAGLLLVFLLCAGVILAGRRPRKLATRHACPASRQVVIFLACAAAIVFPAKFSFYYPYASSRPEPEGAQVYLTTGRFTHGGALLLRFTRLARLLKPSAASVGLSHEEIAALEGEIDSRWVLVRKTLRAIAARPFGHWPEPFTRVDAYCGEPEVCEYPHNLALEVGYYFGWLPFGLTVIGILLAGWRAISEAGHSGLVVQTASVSFVGYLGFAQVSGNLIDHMLPLVLGAIWAISREVRR